MADRPGPDPVKFPRPAKLKRRSEIIGGLWDTREPGDWKPEDGRAATAYGPSGKPMGHPQCCRRRKKTQGGGRCCRRVRTAAKTGEPLTDVCHSHGGKKGERAKAQARALRHGRYSPFLDGSEAERFLALADDLEHLLDPTEPLALVDLQIQEHIRRAKLGDTRAFRQMALVHWEQVHGKMADEEVKLPAPVQAAWSAMGDFLQLGVSSDSEMQAAVALADKRLLRASQARQVGVAEEDALTRARVVAAFSEFQRVLQEMLPGDLLVAVLREIDYRVLAGGSAVTRPELVEDTAPAAVAS